MNIKTKFNLNDTAWYMRDNKPKEVVISAIEIFHAGTRQDYIKYNARSVIDSVSWLEHINLFENMIFKTKDNLIKSVFGENIEEELIIVNQSIGEDYEEI